MYIGIYLYERMCIFFGGRKVTRQKRRLSDQDTVVPEHALV